MAKLTSETVIKYLIDLIHINLEEIEDIEKEGGGNLFIVGEKIAYVECLEILQMWEKSDEYGLNYDIEGRYPIG